MNLSKKALSSIFAIIILFSIASCKKEPGGSFSWNYKGTNYNASSSKIVMINAGKYVIKAKTVDNQDDVSIELVSLDAGTYTLNSITANALYLERTIGNILLAMAGTVIITNTNSGKSSGSFSAALENGEALSGNFSNLSVQ